VSGRAGVPRPGSDACSLGKYVVTAIGDLAQLLDGFIQVAAFGGVPHGGAVEGAVEQLIFGTHNPAYRTQIRFRQTQPRNYDQVAAFAMRILAAAVAELAALRARKRL
jgi:hypothetical protein